MIPEINELNRIRMDEDLSYERLAREIGDLSAGALFRLMKGETVPIDRTLNKVRKFIASRKSGRRRRAQ
jgi:predicted transcriptional regulator